MDIEDLGDKNILAKAVADLEVLQTRDTDAIGAVVKDDEELWDVAAADPETFVTVYEAIHETTWDDIADAYDAERDLYPGVTDGQ
jgi:hypothetical protein